MGLTKNHLPTPDQFAVCDVMPNLATVNFKFSDGRAFCIDNENDVDVSLSVKFYSMDTFVTKLFRVGANPYLLKEIAANAVLTAPVLAKLKYGY